MLEDSSLISLTKANSFLTKKEKSLIIIESILESLMVKQLFIPFKVISLSSLKIHHQKLRRKTSPSSPLKKPQNNLNKSYSLTESKHKRSKTNVESNKSAKLANSSIKKLETLRKNICKEKATSAKHIHSKSIDKVPQNDRQMICLIQQLKSLRKQVKEVKQMNNKLINQNFHTQKHYDFSVPMSSPGYTNPEFLKKLNIGKRVESRQNDSVKRPLTPKITIRYISPMRKPDSGVRMKVVSSAQLMKNERGTQRRNMIYQSQFHQY